jgi:hypothetical protein
MVLGCEPLLSLRALLLLLLLFQLLQLLLLGCSHTGIEVLLQAANTVIFD